MRSPSAQALSFAPTDAGDRPDTLTITDNAAGSPHTAGLDGNALPRRCPRHRRRPCASTPRSSNHQFKQASLLLTFILDFDLELHHRFFGCSRPLIWRGFEGHKNS